MFLLILHSLKRYILETDNLSATKETNQDLRLLCIKHLRKCQLFEKKDLIKYQLFEKKDLIKYHSFEKKGLIKYQLFEEKDLLTYKFTETKVDESFPICQFFINGFSPFRLDYDTKWR